MSKELSNNAASIHTYGLFGPNYVCQLANIFLAGDYFMLSTPLYKGCSLTTRVTTNNSQNGMNSSNDHQNLQLHHSMVNNIFHNFIPANWTNNSAYNGFSACRLSCSALLVDNVVVVVATAVAIVVVLLLTVDGLLPPSAAVARSRISTNSSWFRRWRSSSDIDTSRNHCCRCDAKPRW